MPVFHFSTRCKHHEISGFVMFSGGIEMGYWLFQDTFETRKRSFIGAFSICMTLPVICKA